MTDKSAGEALLAELEDVYDAVYNDEYTGKGSTASASSRAAIRAVIERHEALRASPQPSEQAIDLPTHMNAMCEHLCARISNWIGAVAVNGSLSGTADDACKELLRNTFTALQNELTYLKALREADEPVAPDDDADIAALHRALEVYSSVCGEVADTASLAAVITDRRSMCTAAPVAAGSAAMTSAPEPRGEELLPCPFCGSPAARNSCQRRHDFFDAVECTNEICGVFIIADENDQNEVAKWNARAAAATIARLQREAEGLRRERDEARRDNPPLPWHALVGCKFPEFKTTWSDAEKLAWLDAFQKLVASTHPDSETHGP